MKDIRGAEVAPGAAAGETLRRFFLPRVTSGNTMAHCVVVGELANDFMARRRKFPA